MALTERMRRSLSKPNGMQRRHFELIADIIGGLSDNENKRDIALEFAGRLSATNPGFDRARFLRACGEE